MRNNHDDALLNRPVIEAGLRLRAMHMVPADNQVMDKGMPPWWVLNPAGNVDILMPAVTPDMDGLMFFITNISANTITLKTAADAAFTTAIVLATMESTWVAADGTAATQPVAWRAAATAAST